MSPSDSYELVDFGAGRKLERFGPYLLDRPSPAAERARHRRPHLWSQAHARFERSESGPGGWTTKPAIEVPWHWDCGRFSLELKLTEFGHLGVFAEQQANWEWIAAELARLERPRVLNLFAYTGASTLAAAAAGAEVVHVDAAANVVAWARRNADISGLAEAPVRWIVDDALKFVRRELKRGQGYQAVLLDPPAFGHGPKGQHWKLAEQLDEMLDGCFELCRKRGTFVLLSCHSGVLGTAAGLRELARSRHSDGYAAEALELELETSSGDRLHSGAAVRWTRRT